MRKGKERERKEEEWSNQQAEFSPGFSRLALAARGPRGSVKSEKISISASKKRSGSSS
jgi:hypothetical protein